MSTTAATIPTPRVSTDRAAASPAFVSDVIDLLERHDLGPAHGDTNWAVGWALTELRAFVAAVAAAPARATDDA